MQFKVSGSTLKVNFIPYLLDLILFRSIDPVRHKASVKDGVLTVTLFKKVSDPWSSLEAEGEEEQLNEKKQRALAEQASLDAELDSQRSDRRLAEEKHALRKQMKLEEMERNRVENLKQEEKEQAEKEVYDTFSQMHQQQQKQLEQRSNIKPKQPSGTKKKSVHFGEPSSQETSRRVLETEEMTIDGMLAADDIEDEKPSSREEDSRNEAHDELDEDEDGDHDDGPETHSADEDAAEGDYCFVSAEDEQEVRYIPPPRVVNVSADAKDTETGGNKININFTPRVFPTPMRESKAAEEEDWIAKNRKHLKMHGVLGKSLTKGNGVDMSEEDPVWLKAKGDDFLRGGDVRSALNAYSAALDADDRAVACYANRSICFLKLNMFADCRSDCTRGIELITEDMDTATAAANGANSTTSSNSSGSSLHAVGKLGAMLVKLHLRRGAAVCQLGLYTEALTDYMQASTRYQQLHVSQLSALSAVDITLESITADSQRLKLLVEVDRMKKDADAMFADEKIEDAKLKYTAALQILPVHVGCLSNRAACFMAVGDLQGCVDDCSTAIALLTQSPEASISSQNQQPARQQKQLTNMLQSILPAAGSEKRKVWTVKTLLRRGVALGQQERLDEAVQDYARAAAFDPNNEAIQADYKKMLELRDQFNLNRGSNTREVQ